MTPITLPAAPPLVTVTVNGQEVQLPKGKNLLQALLDAGHYIPHYCYHPSLSVAGNCRLCLIEIEGRPKPEVSCNMVVSDGLKIKTEGEVVEGCRKGMMEFLLVNHPLDCPICDRGGECMLQRYSMEYGWGTARTTDWRRRFHKPQFDELIDIERNRCIMCTRCVRFCDEVGGEHVMGVFGHGDRNYIGTYGNGPVSNMFSGNVIDLCPVGCLTSKPFRFKARAWELRQTLTTTRTCNGPATAWTRNGDLYRVTPPPRRRNGLWTIDEDTRQFLSNEARFGTYYANNPERLTQPLAREAKKGLAPAKWEDALNAAAAALRACGPGEACFLAGERSSNEEFYLLSRMARQLCRTPHIDWRMRYSSEGAAQAAGRAFGAATGDFELLRGRAYGATLLIGADLLGGAPDIALHFREAARRGRTKLALLDTRIGPWMADHAAAMAIEAPEKLASAVRKLAEGVRSGMAPQGYEKIHALLTGNAQGLIAVGLDYAGGALNPVLVPAVLELKKALGEGWQFMPLTGARNARGAFAAGAQSDRLATGLAGDPDVDAAQAKLWGGGTVADVDPLAAPGLLERAAEGAFKVLVLHRADELVHHPRRELVEAAIAATPTVIAIDIFPSWITEKAAIVLPGSLFYETDGSMTDIDGTLQRLTQGTRPRGGAQEEWRILQSLSTLMGAGRQYKSAGEVFGDLVCAWNAPAGMKLDDLTLPGPGTLAPQVHATMLSRKTRPDFKLAHDEPVDLDGIDCDDLNPPANGLRLLSIQHAQGLDHLGSRSTEFDALRPQPKIELSPVDADRLGLAAGDWVRLEGAEAPASQVEINPMLAAGVCYGAANVLGLRLAAGAPALPAIELVKTEAPVAAPQTPPAEQAG
jgi:NADH-quinone oxidoreductase subunit G